jgi:hypothetical protein
VKKKMDESMRLPCVAVLAPEQVVQARAQNNSDPDVCADGGLTEKVNWRTPEMVSKQIINGMWNPQAPKPKEPLRMGERTTHGYRR